MKTKQFTLLLFISVCIIWGTTWFAMEVVLYSIPPILATAMRFFIAAPILVILAKACNEPLLFPKGKMLWLFIVSILYFAIPFSLMIYSEQYISSGLASIIFANMPIAVMLTSGIFLGLRLAKHQISGLIVAVLSLCGILGGEMPIDGSDYLIGISALAVAVGIHALMYVMVQKQLNDVPVLTYNALPCFIASLILFAVSFMTESFNIYHFSWESIGAVVYLGVTASVGGIVAYFKLGQLSTPFQASLCFLIFPVVALLIACYVNGEVLSKQSLFLIFPLLAGILLAKTPTSFFQKEVAYQK